MLCAILVAPEPTTAGQSDNSVRFAYEQTLPNVDPNFNANRLGIIIAESVWDTLVARDPATGELTGNLAVAWRRIDDLTLEFDLRQGVRFHNGEEFDADDVVYTIDFLANPESKVIAPNRVNWLSHAQRVDKYRVRVITKQPFAAALLYLAYPLIAMQPNEYYARVGPAGMNLKPVGTGPYRVVEHALGKRLLLERNSDYYRGGPKRPATIERVEIRFIPDPQTRIAEVVAGGLDLVMNVSRDQAEQMRTVPHLRVLPGGSYRYAFLQMNTTPATPAPQLRDVRVRQAIAHAIDRDTLAAHLVGEGAAVLHTVCHPSQFGCTDAGAPRYAFDQDRARELLREAGYPQGFAIDLYAYRDRNAVEAIMGYLAEVGIRAKLRYLQEAAVDTARHENRAGLMYVGYGPLSDIRSSLSFYHNFTPNDVNRDAEIRDLVLRGDAMMDVETRKGLYARGLALIAERAYALPLYSLPNFYVAAKELEFDPPADETPRFYEMSYR